MPTSRCPCDQASPTSPGHLTTPIHLAGCWRYHHEVHFVFKSPQGATSKYYKFISHPRQSLLSNPKRPGLAIYLSGFSFLHDSLSADNSVLQIKIWESSISTQILRFVFFYPQGPTGDERREAKNTSPVPGILQACHLSRVVALKAYVVLRERRMPTPMYYNISKDILLIQGGVWALIQIFNYYLNDWRFGVQVPHQIDIRHIAVTGLDNDIYGAHGLRTTGDAFKRMVEKLLQGETQRLIILRDGFLDTKSSTRTLICRSTTADPPVFPPASVAHGTMNSILGGLEDLIKRKGPWNVEGSSEQEEKRTKSLECCTMEELETPWLIWDCAWCKWNFACEWYLITLQFVAFVHCQFWQSSSILGDSEPNSTSNKWLLQTVTTTSTSAWLVHDLFRSPQIFSKHQPWRATNCCQVQDLKWPPVEWTPGYDLESRLVPNSERYSRLARETTRNLNFSNVSDISKKIYSGLRPRGKVARQKCLDNYRLLRRVWQFLRVFDEADLINSRWTICEADTSTKPLTKSHISFLLKV